VRLCIEIELFCLISCTSQNDAAYGTRTGDPNFPLGLFWVRIQVWNGVWFGALVSAFAADCSFPAVKAKSKCLKKAAIEDDLHMPFAANRVRLSLGFLGRFVARPGRVINDMRPRTGAPDP